MDLDQSVSDAPKTDSSASVETKNDIVAYETHRKLLGEKKRRDEENAKLREELESLKQNELELQGKKDEAIQYWKSKASEVENKLKEERGSFAWNAISGQIREYAAKKGCKDTDLLIETVKNKRDALAALQVGDSSTGFKVESNDLEFLIDDVRKKHSVLFGQNVKIADGVPNNKVEFKKEKKLDELSQTDLIKMAIDKFSK